MNIEVPTIERQIFEPVDVSNLPVYEIGVEQVDPDYIKKVLAYMAIVNQ